MLIAPILVAVVRAGASVLFASLNSSSCLGLLHAEISVVSLLDRLWRLQLSLDALFLLFLFFLLFNFLLLV